MQDDFLELVKRQLQGEVSGLTDDQLLNTYVPEGTQFLDRSIAPDKAAAAISNAAWVRAQKGKRDSEIYRTQTERIQPGISIIKPGPKLTDKAKLAALDNNNKERRKSGEMLLDYYAHTQPNKATSDILEEAKLKYAYINQVLGKETHHMLEIDGTDQYLYSAPANQRLAIVEAMLKEGFHMGDGKQNQTALHGTSDPGPIGSASTKPSPDFNEHQAGVHPEYMRIARELGMPNPRFNENTPADRSIPREAKNLSPDMKDFIRTVKRVQHENERMSKMKFYSEEQRIAAALLHGHTSRLAVQNAKGIGRNPETGMVDKNNSGIKRTLGKIDQELKNVHGPEQIDAERQYLANLGIDIDDYTLGNQDEYRRRR